MIYPKKKEFHSNIKFFTNKKDYYFSSKDQKNRKQRKYR